MSALLAWGQTRRFAEEFHLDMNNCCSSNNNNTSFQISILRCSTWKPISNLILEKELSEANENLSKQTLKKEDITLEDEEEKSYFEKLIQFQENDSKVLDFPPSLNKKQRAKIHKIADLLGLEHSSKGFGKKRWLSVSKPHVNIVDGKVEETYFFEKYIGLTGPVVNATAYKYLKYVPPEYVRNRQRRDGKNFHITLVSGPEVEQLHIQCQDDTLKQRVLDGIAKIPDDWIEVGLGKVEEHDDEAYFVVLDWESANACRLELGLPKKDFHITLGYKVNDIHSKVKDRSTLINLDSFKK
jgi:hypothetical protein